MPRIIKTMNAILVMEGLLPAAPLSEGAVRLTSVGNTPLNKFKGAFCHVTLYQLSATLATSVTAGRGGTRGRLFPQPHCCAFVAFVAYHKYNSRHRIICPQMRFAFIPSLKKLEYLKTSSGGNIMMFWEYSDKSNLCQPATSMSASHLLFLTCARSRKVVKL